MILSKRQVSIDQWVLLALAFNAANGLWSNSRAGLLNGVAVYAVTYVSYGGRVRAVHGAALLAALFVIQTFIFPLIDLQRGLEKKLSADVYVQESFRLIGGFFASADARLAGTSDVLDTYAGWDTRLLLRRAEIIVGSFYTGDDRRGGEFRRT